MQWTWIVATDGKDFLIKILVDEDAMYLILKNTKKL
ncbi:hypothetical protein PBAL39_18664 [Pedobacter sp. BAL39]|nr:hypothetical protein PBAL39_18664 [Pedobacter sp. BAL39]